MKKFRILALIMTCAILLSSIMIPVSAETADYTATNVVGKTISIDGAADPSEGWSTVPSYYLEYYYADLLNGDIKEGANKGDYNSVEKAKDDEYSQVKIAYDEDFLYVYFETPHANTYKTYFDIMQSNGALNKVSNSQNGETMRVIVDLRADAPNTWAGIDANGNIGVQGGKDKGSMCDVIWFRHAKNITEGNTTYWSYFTSGEHESFYTHTKMAKGRYANKTTVELQIPLAPSYKNALKTDGGLDLKIGVGERVTVDKSSNMGYSFSSEKYNLDQGTKGIIVHFDKITTSKPLVATNTYNKYVVVDGHMSADEGWGNPLLYTDNNGNPATLRMSTDGKYVYLLYQSGNSNWINNGWSPKYTVTPTLYLTFNPTGYDGFDIELRTFTSGDSWYAHNKIWQSLTDGDNTYVWGDGNNGVKEIRENVKNCTCDGTGAGHGGGTGDYQARGFVQYFKNTNGGASYAGTDTLNNTQIAMSVVTQTEITTNKDRDNYGFLTIEMAFPISEALSQALLEGTVDCTVKATEKSHKSTDNAINYVAGPTTITMPQITTPTIDAIGQLTGTVELDGIMNDGEGWDNATTYTFGLYTNKAWGGGTNVARNENASVLKYAHDGDYLYVYYEVTDPEMFTKETHYLEPNNQKPQSDSLYLRIVPYLGAGFPTATKDGTFFHLRLNVGDNVEAATKKQYGSIYDFTFTDANHTAWGLGIKTLVNQFGFYGSYDSYGDYSTTFAKNTMIALNVVKDGDTTMKKSFEIKIPLSDTYKARIDSGKPAFYFVAQENCYTFNGEANNEGACIISRNGAPFYYDGDFVMTDAHPVALSTTSDVSPVIAGFQYRDNPKDNTKYDIRFVSVVDDYTGFDLNASKLGYIFGYGDNSSTKYSTKIYEELQAGNTTIKASDYDGKYFFCFTITGLTKDTATTYTFDVTCFTKKDALSNTVTCFAPVKVTVVWDGTKVNFTY